MKLYEHAQGFSLNKIAKMTFANLTKSEAYYSIRDINRIHRNMDGLLGKPCIDTASAFRRASPAIIFEGNPEIVRGIILGAIVYNAYVVNILFEFTNNLGSGHQGEAIDQEPSKVGPLRRPKEGKGWWIEFNRRYR